jgi:hypothetical protein
MIVRKLAIALAILITAAAAADAKERRYRSYLDGHLVKAWIDYEYHLDGHLVKILLKSDDIRDGIEIRLVPGWELDPTCPPNKWGEGICAGGQGYFLFEGRWNKGRLSGTARLDRDGCDELYQASGGRTKDGGLMLYPIDDAGKRVVNSKCKAIFKPVRWSNVRRR